MLYDSDFLAQYLPIVVFIVVASTLSCVIVILPKILSTKKINKDKLKGYECGFDPFADAREKFDIRFYLIAILFIIFDLEVAFLIPWAVNISHIGNFGFYSMMFFLLVLTVGFVYEWKKGVLDW